MSEQSQMTMPDKLADLAMPYMRRCTKHTGWHDETVAETMKEIVDAIFDQVNWSPYGEQHSREEATEFLARLLYQSAENMRHYRLGLIAEARGQ